MPQVLAIDLMKKGLRPSGTVSIPQKFVLTIDLMKKGLRLPEN